jgi:hypothetical protein
VKLIQRALALVLIYTLFGLMLATPALAGDASLVNPKLLAGLQPPKGPSAANPPADRKWTPGGKVMTIIGAGLIAAGAFMMTRDNQTIDSSCSGNMCTETQVRWKVVGGVTAGGGAALMIIGLTRRR